MKGKKEDAGLRHTMSNNFITGLKQIPNLTRQGELGATGHLLFFSQSGNDYRKYIESVIQEKNKTII